MAGAALFIFKKMFLSMLSKKFLEWILFWAAGLIVASTKTPHDDKFLAELKKSYFAS